MEQQTALPSAWFWTYFFKVSPVVEDAPVLQRTAAPSECFRRLINPHSRTLRYITLLLLSFTWRILPAYIWSWSCRRRWYRWTVAEGVHLSPAASQCRSPSPCRTGVGRMWTVPTESHLHRCAKNAMATLSTSPIKFICSQILVFISRPPLSNRCPLQSFPHFSCTFTPS